MLVIISSPSRRTGDLNQSSFVFSCESFYLAKLFKNAAVLIKDLIYWRVYHCQMLIKVGVQSHCLCCPEVTRRTSGEHVFFRVESLTHLIDAIHEVHRDTEGQRVMIRISKKGRKDFHSWGSGFPISILLCSFYTSLAINGIFSKFCPITQNLR